MAILVTDRGEIVILQFGIWNIDVTFRLYKNNYTPTPTSEITDFVAADFPGYAPAVRQNPFNDVQTQLDGKALATGPNIIWTCTQTGWWEVYGYFVTYNVGQSNKVLWAERFYGGPAIMQYPNDTILVGPRLSLWSET